MNWNRSVTIHDVAEAAGVSVSTVSRVLNDKDDVAPQTRQRVHDVIGRLGYTSSLAARGLRSRRTNVIGLVARNLAQAYSVELLRGISRAIEELGYEIIAYNGGSMEEASCPDRERRYVGLFGSGIADGVIVATPCATDYPTPSPVVVIDPNVRLHGLTATIATNREGVLAAMAYLTDLGHRRIGFITGREDLQCSRDRLQGYQDGLARAGIPQDDDLIQQGDFTMERGLVGAQRLLGLTNRPTAILAANDISAIGALKAIRDAGLRVPDDISLVGFDNIPHTAYTDPGLTTVDQSIEAMGYLATRLLVRLIRGETLDSQLFTVPTQLVVRGSCRAIAAQP